MSRHKRLARLEKSLGIVRKEFPPCHCVTIKIVDVNPGESSPVIYPCPDCGRDRGDYPGPIRVVNIVRPNMENALCDMHD
jgi:hypothetical protein